MPTSKNPQSETKNTNLSLTSPTAPVRAPQPVTLRRLSAQLKDLERTFPPLQLSQPERDALRRRALFTKEAMHACVELAADPLCAEHRVHFSQAEVDEKRAYVEEAERLTRRLRRLAKRVSDDAVVVEDSLVSHAMRTLDVIEALASAPEGTHLREEVEAARKLVRAERRPTSRRKKDPAPPAPKA